MCGHLALWVPKWPLRGLRACALAFDKLRGSLPLPLFLIKLLGCISVDLECLEKLLVAVEEDRPFNNCFHLIYYCRCTGRLRT